MSDLVVHPTAILLARIVGSGVRLGAQSCVLGEATLADMCQIGEQAFVGEGAHVGKAARISPRATVGAGALVEDGVQVGVAAVVAPGVRIGAHAQVDAGSVVTRDVPPNAVVQGHPAVIVAYVDAPERSPSLNVAVQPGVTKSRVAGVNLHIMREVQDMRGFLCAAEFGRDVPFIARRCFFVYAVPNAQVRGEHAHIRCAQFLVAVKGSVRVMADDGRQREEFRLDRPNLGLHLPPMTWGVQYGYSEDAVLLVLASDHYDPNDYIRDYTDFLDRVQQASDFEAGIPE